MKASRSSTVSAKGHARHDAAAHEHAEQSVDGAQAANEEGEHEGDRHLDEHSQDALPVHVPDADAIR